MARLSERKTILVLTMGDAAGIGPEIIIKALSHPEVFSDCRMLILGDSQVLKNQNSSSIKNNPGLPLFKSPMDVLELPLGAAGIYNPLKDRLDFKVGQPNACTGKACMAYLELAAQLALMGRISAIVTAPISKQAIQSAGFLYTGHTDYLAAATNTKKAFMVAYSKKLMLTSVTGHMSLRRVHSEIKQARVIRAATLLDQLFTAIHNGKHPRIVVTGFNPHAGETGLLGREEVFEITPAVSALQGMNYSVFGPLAADVAISQTYDGIYDAVVTMYHDQTMIPIKLMSRFDACQITLGLPIIRTSVNHGTAEDIAGKNQADPSSMIEAIRLAIKLVDLRNRGYDF